MSKQNIKNGRKKALVIGASMGGLLAARVLADHFEQVIILERDTFPSSGVNRKGVPQGRHTHALLEKGLQIMENLLPGLTAELIKLRATRIEDASLKVLWFQNGGFHQPGISGISGIGVSRPTLEMVVRSRVLALPNVQAVEDCKVSGLVTLPDKSRVLGVRFIKYGDENSNETLEADLVLDASGRGSRSSVWLEKMGYKSPQREEIKINLAYTSCFYRRQSHHMPGQDGIVFLTTPPDRRIAVMLAQDDNCWVVTLGGYLGDHVPADISEFLHAAKKLPTSHIYSVIKDATLLSGPVVYKFPANQRYYYEKLSQFPEGYLVFGDALCSFNPIYGQGMTVAAMEAVALAENLTEGDAALAKRFFAKASKVIDLSWDSAVGSDLSFAEVKGPRTPFIQFINWYISKLHLAAQHDAQVSIAFLKVINMKVSAPNLLKPEIVWRVLKGNFRLIAKNKKLYKSE